jgi:hypothetical protein
MLSNSLSHKIGKLICLAFLLMSCSPSNSEGFAIYLTKNNILPADMESLSYVEPQETPLISILDMVSYDAQSHEIILTESAFERILQFEVSVRGTSFLVCIDKKPIYWGAFWVSLSSLSFNGVTIIKPLDAQDEKSITLTLGYPSSSFYEGSDPRNNEIILNSLNQSKKLINK